MVVMLAAMRELLHPSGKAGQAQSEVGANGAFDAHSVADVIVAVAALEQGPVVQSSVSALGICQPLRAERNQEQGLHLLLASSSTLTAVP